MDHQFAWRRTLCVLLFAVVAMTACRKAPALQSDPAPGPIRSTRQPAPRTTEAERAKFQGTWKYISIERNGKRASPVFVREYLYRFEGTQYSNARNGQVQSKGSFSIDPSQLPGWIDLTENTNITNYGIYQFAGDKLTICLHEKQRRTTFEPPPGRGFILLVLERDIPQLTEFPESSPSPAHTAAAKELQGTWKVTEFHTARGSSAVEDGRIIPYTFEGNKLITVGPGDVRVEIEYRLDPTKSPKQIDQRFAGGVIGPWIAKGIYKLEGDTLTICYGGRDVARPTEFAAKPGDERTMRVHKRVE